MKFVPLRLEILKISGGFLGFLLLFDILINILFTYPQDPLNISPGKLALYFDYGRSTEAKVKRQLGITKETSAPIAQMGWLEPKTWQKEPSQSNSEKEVLVAIYGMSFANDVAEAIEEIDPRFILRKITGPGAPPNHGFAAYSLDRENHDADVVIWGILASSLKKLNSLSGMTSGAELAAPYTFPKYYLQNNQLKAIWPTIDSFDKLLMAKQDKTQWQSFVNQLKQYDPYYNLFSFEQTWLDHSVIIRMIRRAWNQNYKAQQLNKIHTPKGFNQQWEGITVLNQMIKEFAETAQADGKLPLILVINNKGYKDHLFNVIEPTLEDHSIPYISTHTIVPASDLSHFLPDGHFTKKANQKIAQEVINLIAEEKRQ
ncbi:MAG: hypothetical protein AB4062_18470 [Crocosphaera sp.]